MPTILIVEDGENARILERLVQDLGRVVIASDGEGAIAQAGHDKPDLVLLDVMMPGMGGYEICRRLKAQDRTKDTAVIFITGDDAQADEAMALGLGAIDCINEPFAPALVRARLGNHLALARALEELKRMEVTDSLTGLASRRRLIEVGAQELLRAQRSPNSAGLMCALMIDIDRFKAVNDTHGQPAGDAVIQAIARTCMQTVRAIDTVGRLGGEEFAVVVPMTDCRGGVELAERLRERVEATTTPWNGGQGLKVTVSVGVAQGTAKTRSFDALLSAADQALSRAKSAGRNRVAATIYGAPEEVST